MGQKIVIFKLPTDFSEEDIRLKIKRELQLSDFNFHLNNKSLDARNKGNIHWLVNIVIDSDELKDTYSSVSETLIINKIKRNKKITVVGNGPAGFFCAYALQLAGFDTMMIERGSDVDKRDKAILRFESGSGFDPKNNYAFGEGGAGTFSDGKLTSRSKHISVERQFILDSYIKAGAPSEIAYLAHPHLGTDNLKRIVKNLRNLFIDAGGEMHFETMLEDVDLKSNKSIKLKTSKGNLDCDALFIAPGHSAFETYRMMIRNGVPFRTKNFALGSRMEHSQELVNLAQWGKKYLPGVKAAEYRLTSEADGKHPVYSFCMCPGGMVVPATAYANQNIVNGMSHYQRDGRFANAACVAGINPDVLAGKITSPVEALYEIEKLESLFYNITTNYASPACSIADFITGKLRNHTLTSSYPLGLSVAPLWDLLPAEVTQSIRAGLIDFKKKMYGFENGILLGLESKTSSTIQVIREKTGETTGFENLYIVGEGSGYAGGIISSAADGLKAALAFIQKQ
jgi:uncharacterized FAD-dependent dehydrogenase